MQASLARWAIVSCSLVGMLGCAAGPKPSWWPGRKPNYSNSSTTPPQLPPPNYGQQQPQYDPANGFGAAQNPAAGQQYAGNGYPQGAGGYPPAGAAGYGQGGYNPQDYAGAQAPAGQPGYDPAYPQSGGGYADPSYPTNNPYASAGQQADYQNAQQAQAYPGQAGAGYPPATVSNQYVTGGAGAGAAAGGMQTADSRYAAGVGAAGGGGYNTDSRYDPGNGQSAGQSSAWGAAGGSGAAAGGAGGAAADPWSGAANSSTYPPSTGGYPDAGGQQDPHYRPGGTGDYSTPTAATGTSNAWSQGGSGGAGAGYNAASSPYPSSAGGGAYSGATGQVDRYGQPISGAAR